MRATRNAAKGTPPPAKNVGKGTPGKGTPKAEKKEDSVTAEKDEENLEVESVPVTTSDVEVAHPHTSDGVEPEAVVALDEDKKGKSEAAEKLEALNDATEKVSTQEATETTLKKGDTQVSKAVEETVSEKGLNNEIQEESPEDQIANVGADEARNEDDEEEVGEGDEDGEDDDDGGDNELVDPRPLAKRHKRKKLEVFVGGLDKDATMDDVKNTFEAVGEVQEVRLMTHPETGKNKGFAFIRFATAEQAISAAAELDRTKIRDKECAVVPSEENDTLFVGNICKSWSPEQVTKKLKEFGVEGIDEMVLVEDDESEGNNKGHAFLEFVSHSDAIKAFKRLSKPDAIFGCDRSAKVAWAEGFSEPDETVMAKVKSVFISGLPEEWDDEKIKEYFGKYGGIDRLVLAKNIAKSKRTDYAFVNYATRDSAIAAIGAMNDAELTDSDKKIKLKVELAKPTSRRKRMRGHRGSYPVGGGPSKQKKGDKKGGEVGHGSKRRVEGSRGFSEGGRKVQMGSEKKFRGTKRKAQEGRPLPEERSRERHNRGSRNFKTVSRGNSGVRIGSSSRQRQNSTYDDEDYMPLGARISPPARGYRGRPTREVAYPLRPERGVPYSALRGKRSYTAVDEEAAYYGSGPRSYPRARVEYGDAGFYQDPLRPTSLGHHSLGHALPGGGYGYSSVLPGGADYGGYAPVGVADPRGAAFPPTYLGGHGGSGYSRSGAYY